MNDKRGTATDGRKAQSATTSEVREGGRERQTDGDAHAHAYHQVRAKGEGACIYSGRVRPREEAMERGGTDGEGRQRTSV